jgi:hypothetical protein
MAAPIPITFLATAVGFLAGGVVINSVIAELPEAPGGGFRRFCLGGAVYALVLLLA